MSSVLGFQSSCRKLPRMTGRDNKLLSVLFLAPDRSPALLPTLANIYQDPRYRLRPTRVLWIYGCCECQMALVKVVSDILKLDFFVCALPDGDG